LRQALPRYWQQIQLFLNVGSVREGERIFVDGLPWLVKQINIFSILENPVAQISQRVRIDELVDLKSRPVRKEEPWFPCVRGDWVLLSDGMRGKVIGISLELVQLIERGGAHRTYQTLDFLALSPLNLTTNFRVKETIGITYNLQQESVTSIPDILKAHVEKRISDEGYADKLLNLRVEFERANTSSLDLVVIADFDGALADLYNRLRRAIQRWCVEACSANNWEIPFTQLTLHQAQGETL
jgi:small-conductance mechanosensitive channel